MKYEDNILAQKSMEFAVRIVNLFKHLTENDHNYVLPNQILRSGTSIGANIFEGINAQTKPDFLTKINIALKEATETEYWLNLLVRTDYITKKEFDSLECDLDEIKRLLVSTVKTTKNNLSKE